VKIVSTADEALHELQEGDIDCVVVALVLPGRDGLALIEEIKGTQQFRDLPVIVYTGKDLTSTESHSLKKYAESVITKTTEGSHEQLLNDTALFLHRVEDKLPPRSKRMLMHRRGVEESIAGRNVLVIDDDIRNIFALTSVLESHAVHVLHAENGRKGIETLLAHPEIDMVLLDIMMPELDGYETLALIRENPRYRSLPIIAITAKALKEDREKCIQAGAFDYLPKPVDPDKLLQLIRMWTRTYPKTGS